MTLPPAAALRETIVGVQNESRRRERMAARAAFGAASANAQAWMTVDGELSGDAFQRWLDGRYPAYVPAVEETQNG